jgi:hypothetical protein
MNAEKRVKFQALIDEFHDRIKNFDNQEIVDQIKKYGPMYLTWNGMEKGMRDVKTHGLRYQSIIDIAENFISISDGTNLLELGCNSGYTSMFLKQKNIRNIYRELAKKQKF